MLLGFDVKSMDFANQDIVASLDSFISEAARNEQEPAIVINGTNNTGKGLIMQFINNKLISEKELKLKLAICLEILDDFSDYFKGGTNISCTLRRITLHYRTEVVGVNIHHDLFDKHAIVDRSAIFRVILRLVNSLNDEHFTGYFNDGFKELFDASEFPEVGDEFKLDFLLKLFINVGLPESIFQEVVNLLKGIVILNQFKYEVINDQVYISDTNKTIAYIAKKVNIDPDQLKQSLTCKSVKDPNGDQMITYFTLKDAIIVKERFAKHLYESLFYFLSGCFDKMLSNDLIGVTRSVTMVVCSSFENNANFKENGLHSFLSNFCSDMCLKFYHNEVVDHDISHIRSLLQNIYDQDLFEEKLKHIEKITNTSVINGLEKLYGKGGIFESIEAESSIIFKKSINNLVGRIQEISGLVSKTNNSFTINHLIDTVEYGNITFLDDNVDNLQEALANSINSTLNNLKILVQESTPFEIEVNSGFDKSYSSSIKTKSYCLKVRRTLEELFKGLQGKVPYFINLINLTSNENKLRINQLAKQLTVFSIEKKLLIANFSEKNSLVEAVNESIKKTIDNEKELKVINLKEIDEQHLELSEEDEQNCVSLSDEEEVNSSFIERKEKWKRNQVMTGDYEDEQGSQNDAEMLENFNETENNVESQVNLEFSDNNHNEDELTSLKVYNVEIKEDDNLKSESDRNNCLSKSVCQNDEQDGEPQNKKETFSSANNELSSLEPTDDFSSEIKIAKNVYNSHLQEENTLVDNFENEDNKQASLTEKHEKKFTTSDYGQFYIASNNFIDFSFYPIQFEWNGTEALAVVNQFSFEYLGIEKPSVSRVNDFTIVSKEKVKLKDNEKNEQPNVPGKKVVKFQTKPTLNETKQVKKQDTVEKVKKVVRINPDQLISNERIRLSQFQSIVGFVNLAKVQVEDNLKSTNSNFSSIKANITENKKPKTTTEIRHRKTPSFQQNTLREESLARSKQKEINTQNRPKTEKIATKFVSKIRRDLGTETDVKNKKNKMLEYDRKLKEQSKMNYQNNLGSVESKLGIKSKPQVKYVPRSRAKSVIPKKTFNQTINLPADSRKRHKTVEFSNKSRAIFSKMQLQGAKSKTVVEREPKFNYLGKKEATSVKPSSTKTVKIVDSRVNSTKRASPKKLLKPKETEVVAKEQAVKVFTYEENEKYPTSIIDLKYNANRQSSIKMLIKQHFLNYAAQKVKKSCDINLLETEFKMNLELKNTAMNVINQEGLAGALDYEDICERLVRLEIPQGSQLSDLIYVLWRIYYKDRRQAKLMFLEDANKVDVFENKAEEFPEPSLEKKRVKFGDDTVGKRRRSFDEPIRKTRKITEADDMKFSRAISFGV